LLFLMLHSKFSDCLNFLLPSITYRKQSTFPSPGEKYILTNLNSFVHPKFSYILCAFTQTNNILIMITFIRRLETLPALLALRDFAFLKWKHKSWPPSK
jgi:hypothetical protein